MVIVRVTTCNGTVSDNSYSVLARTLYEIQAVLLYRGVATGTFYRRVNQRNVSIPVSEYERPFLEAEVYYEIPPDVDPIELRRAINMNKLDEVANLTPDLVDINYEFDNGSTPLTLAIKRGYNQIVQYLVDNGALINEFGYRSSTPLFLAVENNNQHLVNYLLWKGADPNIPCDDETFMTPLHMAAVRGYKTIAENLLAHGAKRLPTDCSGETAESLARAQGYNDLADLLRDYDEVMMDEPGFP